MKIMATIALLLGAPLVWLVVSKLSSDAVGMMVGLVFGSLAFVPVMLLVLASQRRTHPYGDDYDDYDDPPLRMAAPQSRPQLPAPSDWPYEPPVVFLYAPREQPEQAPVVHNHLHVYGNCDPLAMAAQQMEQQYARSVTVTRPERAQLTGGSGLPVRYEQ